MQPGKILSRRTFGHPQVGAVRSKAAEIGIVETFTTTDSNLLHIFMGQLWFQT